MSEKQKEIFQSSVYHNTDNLLNTQDIVDMIKALKGVSARLLIKEYGDQLKDKLCGGHLWNPSYYIATVSENTENHCPG